MILFVITDKRSGKGTQGISTHYVKSLSVALTMENGTCCMKSFERLGGLIEWQALRVGKLLMRYCEVGGRGVSGGGGAD